MSEATASNALHSVSCFAASSWIGTALPNELVLIILDDLVEPEPRAWHKPTPGQNPVVTLRATSLVSRSWRRRSHGMLYENVVLQDYVAVALFARSLASNRSLGLLVTSITFPYRMAIENKPLIYRKSKLSSRDSALQTIFNSCCHLARMRGCVEDVEYGLFPQYRRSAPCRDRIRALELQIAVSGRRFLATTLIDAPVFALLEELTVQTHTIAYVDLLKGMPSLRVLNVLGRPTAVRVGDPFAVFARFLSHAGGALRIVRIAHVQLPWLDDLAQLMPHATPHLEELVLYNCLVHAFGDLAPFSALLELVLSWPDAARARSLPPALRRLSVVTPSSAYVLLLKLESGWPVHSLTDEAQTMDVQLAAGLVADGVLEHWGRSAPLLRQISLADDAQIVRRDVYEEVAQRWRMVCDGLGLHVLITVDIA